MCIPPLVREEKLYTNISIDWGSMSTSRNLVKLGDGGSWPRQQATLRLRSLRESHMIKVCGELHLRVMWSLSELPSTGHYWYFYTTQHSSLREPPLIEQSSSPLPFYPKIGGVSSLVWKIGVLPTVRPSSYGASFVYPQLNAELI